MRLSDPSDEEATRADGCVPSPHRELGLALPARPRAAGTSAMRRQHRSQRIISRTSGGSGPTTTGRVRPAGSIDLIVVAIPAHNEGGRIASCLGHVDGAARRWGGPVMTVIAADACADETVSEATSFRPSAMSVDVIAGTWRRASPARRAAVERALEMVGGGMGHERIWIANTDADCSVDSDWLVRQVAEADRGVDLVAGVVDLDGHDTSVALHAAFAAHYQLRPGDRPHVHAANLGIRASAYDELGGWRRSTSIGEEHHLVAGALRRRMQIAWPDDLVVRTSGRTTGRVPGGFASVLRRLQRAEDGIADSA